MLWCQCGIWPPQTWSHTCHGVPIQIPHRLASQVDKQACLCPNMHMEVWAPHGRALGCPNIRWATTFHHLGMKLRGQKPVCSSQNFAPVSCVKHLWLSRDKGFSPWITTGCSAQKCPKVATWAKHNFLPLENEALGTKTSLLLAKFCTSFMCQTLVVPKA